MWIVRRAKGERRKTSSTAQSASVPEAAHMGLPRVVALLGKTSSNVSSSSVSSGVSSSGSVCLQGQGSSGSVCLHHLHNDQSLQGQGQADQSPALDESSNQPSTSQGRTHNRSQGRPSDTQRLSTPGLFSMDSYREFEGLYEVTTSEEEAPKRPC